MTAHGYSGNPRYLIAPGGLACVVAGVGWARLGGAIASRVPAPRALVGAVLALAPGLPCRCSTSARGWICSRPRRGS